MFNFAMLSPLKYFITNMSNTGRSPEMPDLLANLRNPTFTSPVFEEIRTLVFLYLQ